MRLLLRPALAGLVLAGFTGACGKDAIAPKSLADPRRRRAARIARHDFQRPPYCTASPRSPDRSADGTSTVPALALVSALNPLTRSPELRPYARRIEGARVFGQVLPHRSSSLMAALLPPALMGKTFEWNFTTLQYDTTARAGAPATGVRFILYAINDLTALRPNPRSKWGTSI